MAVKKVTGDLRNRKNVLVGAPDVTASGGALIGNVAKLADIPGDATEPLKEALKAVAVGYLGNDGVTKTVDRQTEKIKDWNGDTVVVLTSEHTVTLKLTFMESANAALLKGVYGTENVTISKAKGMEKIKLVENADALPHNSYTFEIKGAEDAKIRVFAPDAQVTSVGDVTFVKNEVIKYEVELECFADENNVKLYQFIDRKADDEETVGDSASYTFTLAGATGGTYKISVGSKQTGDLQYNDSAEKVKQALVTAGETKANVTGSASSGFTITGVSAKPTVNGSNLTGGSFPDTSVTVS